MINEKEKYIYNSFLKISRGIKNKPFTFRQDFSKLDSSSVLYLKKLNSFFSSHSNVNYDDFFIAPYRIYKSDDYFDLHFYCTRRAIKCYAEFMRQRETSDTESEDTISTCKECCSYIYNFCKENSITLEEYKRAVSGTTPVALQHLKDHKINFYLLHGLGVNPRLSDDAFIYEFAIADFYNLFEITKQKFIKSKRLKDVIRTALKLIEEKLLIFEKTKLQLNYNN